MSSCGAPLVGLGNSFLDVQHRVGDPGISPAAAEVSAHAFADALRVVAGLCFPDQANRTHDLAGRAEPALQAVMRDEGGLDRMQLVPARDAFNREHIGAVVAERQRQARIDPSTVDQDRARAALAAVTSLLGTCQVEMLAQEIEQRNARVSQLDVPPPPVNGEADAEVHAVLRSMLCSNWIAAAGS